MSPLGARWDSRCSDHYPDWAGSEAGPGLAGEAGVSSHGMISYQQLTGFNQPVDTINQERDHTEQARLSKYIDTDN